MYVVWRMPAKRECTLHAKKIEQSFRRVGVDGIWTRRHFGVRGDESVGATSDDDDGLVYGKGSGRDLGNQGPDELLAILVKSCAVSWYVSNRSMDTYPTEEMSYENDHYSPLLARVYPVEFIKRDCLSSSIHYWQVCSFVKD